MPRNPHRAAFQRGTWSGYTGLVTEEHLESGAELPRTDSGQPSGKAVDQGPSQSPDQAAASQVSLQQVSPGQVSPSAVRPGGLRLVVAALILRAGDVLICQRRADQPMALQWEFPGGKIEPGEGPEEALARELSEELGIDATIGPKVTHIRHNYRHGGAVDLQFFAVHEFKGEIENRIFKDVRWTKLEELPNYDFLVADRGLIRDLAQGKLL